MYLKNLLAFNFSIKRVLVQKKFNFNSAFHKTFDRQFAKFVVNFISSLRTWEFQYITVNQMANFETNLGISRRTSWECGEVISQLLSVVVWK